MTVGGASSPDNIQDEDNLGVAPWGWIGGAGVVTPNAGDPLGGTDAYTVEDDGVVAQEVLERIQAFTGDGVKTVEVVFKENTMPAGGQSFRLLDITMVGLARLDAQLTSFVSGEPQITMATGTLDYLKEIGAGYWRAGFVTTALVAANQNNFRIYPANVGAQVGKIDVYRVRIYNSAEFSENWDFLNVVELDLANAAQCGQWIGPHEQQTSRAMTQMLSSIGAWWSVDREGLYRGAVLTDPSAETPVHDFTMDNVRDLERINSNDPKSGLPSYRTIVRYDRNYTVQTSGLAADVRWDRRAEWAKEWHEAIVTSPGVQTAYLLSQEAVYDSLLTDYADAAAEAARLQTLRSVRRDRYTFVSAMDAETVLLDLGNYVRVTHDRFLLSAGQVFVIMGIEPDPEEGEITFEVWG